MEKRPIVVRNPAAVRPWQHVLECLSGYLWLGAQLHDQPKTSPLASAFNFGPEPSARQPVRRLVEEILSQWSGEWKDGSSPGQVHEAKLLSLSIEKAGALLGWYPTWDFREAIARTVVWYQQRHVAATKDMAAFSLAQIREYAGAAQSKGLAWARQE
jgi:CDP-glucose 4,6-dehydratase